jgi:hypothetical protein
MHMNPEDVRDILRKKGTRFVSVTFTKKDGDSRTVSGLLKPTSKILGTGRPTPDHLVAIWSPTDGWRSFRADSVIEIK